MRITPVNYKYSYRNSNMNCRKNYTNVTSPMAFEGAQSIKDYKRVLKMLAEKNQEVLEYTPQVFNRVIRELSRKADIYGTNNLGIQVIAEEELNTFLGKKALKHNLKGKFGACFAIGDKYGPIEEWTKVYEAKTILLPKDTDINNLLN